MKRYFSISIIMLITLLISSCTKPKLPPSSVEGESSTSFFAMDTYIEIRANGADSEVALIAAKDKIIELEGIWSATNEKSEIYAINNSNSTTTTISKDTSDIISFALEMADKTNGALDITIYPILTAWGFTTGNYQIPTREEINILLDSIGHEKVKVENGKVTMPEDFQIDLGALGKGYASDIVTEVLKSYAINSALIDIGGNIQTIGVKPDGSYWKLGIKDPFGDGNIGVLEVSEHSVVTSGGYERYFTGEDGKHYRHIIDPATGHPVDNGLESVVIIGNEGKLCEALSTAFFVMGLDKSIDYWYQNDSFDFILLTEENEIYISKGIKNSFFLNENFKSLDVNVVE